MGYSKIKYIFATILMLSSFTLYFFYTELFIKLPEWIYDVLWILFMFDILKVMIPKLSKHSPSGKHLKKFFKEVDYNKEKLLEYIKKMQIRVLITFILYVIFLSVIGILYFQNFINKYHIILIVILLNFIDYFCINTWCVFHKIFIKNKCCNTCRIYNWDHFLKFAPFIFIPDFRTWTLFLLALLALLQWEFSYSLYPERFTDISNNSLKCSQCKLDCRFIEKKREVNA